MSVVYVLFGGIVVLAVALVWVAGKADSWRGRALHAEDCLKGLERAIVSDLTILAGRVRLDLERGRARDSSSCRARSWGEDLAHPRTPAETHVPTLEAIYRRMSTNLRVLRALRTAEGTQEQIGWRLGIPPSEALEALRELEKLDIAHRLASGKWTATP